MGKQNKNKFDCQGGDFSLKSLDDSFDAEDGEWYPDNSDETDLVLAASLCKNNAVKKEKKKKKGKKKEKRTQENNPLKKLFKYDEKKEDDLESEDEEIERTERSQSKYHPMYEMAHALEEFCDLKVVDGEVYYYENTYYMHLTKDQIIELYKLRVDPKLHGAVNLRNYRDLYDYIKMEQILKYEMPKNEKLYCPFENGHRAAGQAANAGCSLWHSTGLQSIVGVLRKQACGFPAVAERAAGHFQSVQQKCKRPQVHHRSCGINLVSGGRE